MNDQINTVLADLVEDLNRPHQLDIEDVMTRVVEFATTTLGVTDGSIFLAHGTSAGPLFESVVPTSPEVAKVDDLQHDTGVGPSVESLVTGEPVMSTDLARDDRWPGWREAAVGMGITGVVATRLRARERTIGALNFYSRGRQTMSAADVVTAQQLAKHIAAVLAAAIDQSTLNDALLSRSVIARAQGLVMERYGVDEQRAFEVLKRISQHHNIKVREVAERLATGEPLDDIGSAASGD